MRLRSSDPYECIVFSVPPQLPRNERRIQIESEKAIMLKSKKNNKPAAKVASSTSKGAKTDEVSTLAQKKDVPEISDTARLANLIAESNRIRKSPWYSIRNGLLAGLGSAIGATLLLSVLVHILQPFSIFSQITNQLQQIKVNGKTHH